MDNALIIFIRNPEPGKVKTRLAAAVGDERALAIYRELLDLTRRAALGSEAEKYLWYSHFVDKADGWPESDFRKMLQQGEDLGDRMAYAFETALADHDKAVIIGSDCPYLSPVLLDEAFELLDDSDFVIGPATDGGYYLLGMNRFAPEVFQGIEWSTDTVFRETVARIRQSGADYEVLPLLSDVDEIGDWERFKGGRG
ncbi:MAG: TIGR04282 family arsenosugar biosynthesis glycosyltransferase [Lewinellaceae bacterium]|nr:TIGR04282 family arsenosugar biosynthesis glycosyltransferase [Lewinellaceae bacterium]